MKRVCVDCLFPIVDAGVCFECACGPAFVIYPVGYSNGLQLVKVERPAVQR